MEVFVRCAGRRRPRGDGQAYGLTGQNGKLGHRYGGDVDTGTVMATDMTLLAASFVEVAWRIVAAIALAVVTTSLSLRLLGVRRGWGKALGAGAAGWVLGGALALRLNHGDWGAVPAAPEPPA